jgi:hypothetical protein
MQDSLAVMNQCVGHLARLDVPNANCGVARAADDDLVVVLQAQYGTCVTGENLKMPINDKPFNASDKVQSAHLVALKRVTIPNLDRVIT